MIITDKFVLLAAPKTGTSFTTAVLRAIHARRRLIGRVLPLNLQQRVFRHFQLERPGYREHLIPRFESVATDKQRFSRHGSYRDIPESARNLTIAANVRDPFALYPSSYLFGMRSRKNIRHLADPEVLKKNYPGYPDISFEQYYELIHQYSTAQYLQGIDLAIELGEQTIRFIHLFFKDPAEVFRKIDDNYIESESFREDMVDIHFIRQESLREDFKQFLQDMDYSQDECALVESFLRQNVAVRDRSERKMHKFYTAELTDKVLQRDALLFKLFPGYLP